MTKVKREVVMLPQEKKAVECPLLIYKNTHDLWDKRIDADLELSTNPTFNRNHVLISNGEAATNAQSKAIFYELYILSDEPIKVVDYVLANYEFNNKSIEQVYHTTPKGLMIDIGYQLMANRCKKVIASTDTSLGLSQLSEGFIQKYIKRYNEGNPITHVMVEYEEEQIFKYGEKIRSEFTLKLDKQNCISIFPVKDSWTRGEVIALLKEVFKQNLLMWKEEAKLSEFYQVRDKWIEENL